jgi:hypothetical protein
LLAVDGIAKANRRPFLGWLMPGNGLPKNSTEIAACPLKF